MTNKSLNSNTKRKKKGTGTIVKKPNGTYLGKIRIAGYDTFYYSGKSEREVQKKLNEFKAMTDREEIIPRKQTVNTYIRNWLNTVKKPSIKAASYDRLERTFEKQIEPTRVGRSQLGTLSAMEIQQLLNSYTQTLSYSTIKKVYGLLNNCFRYAVAVRDISYNPVDGVVLPKEENIVIPTKEIQIMSETDMQTLEASMKLRYSNGTVRYRYAAAYVLIANTGLRSGEALALTWDNIDFSNQIITISQNASRIKNRDSQTSGGSRQIITSTKTKSGVRRIPLNDKALSALYQLKEQQEHSHIQTNFVIATSNGNMVVQNSFYQIFQNMQKSLGMMPVTIHALRHTFASNLIKAGVDIKIVSQLLGHSSVKITYDTYVHTDLSSAFSAVRKLK